MEKYSHHLGVFFLSLSSLIFELLLIRLFSVLFLSNFAFLGVSVALFGIALGGGLVYSGRSFFLEEKWKRACLWSVICYAVSLAFFFLFLLVFNIVPPPSHTMVLFLACVAAALPFFCVSVCLSVLFMHTPRNINTLYFADLCGAGLGVITAVLLLDAVSLESVFFASILAALISSVFFLQQRGKIGYRMIVGLCVIVLAFIIIQEGSHAISISLLTQHFSNGRETLFAKSNSFSYISVTSDNPVNVFGLFNGVRPAHPIEIYGIRIDGDAYTPIVSFDGNLESVEFLRNDVSSAAFGLAQPGQTLIIGPGGGKDVLQALQAGHTVTGVDINSIIVNDIMKGKFFEFSGNLYSRPDVEIITAEGRSWLERDVRSYTVISLPLVDTWASTSAGNLILVESNLYTVEAFEAYWKHLLPEGFLSISRWDLDGTRLLSLFAETSKRQNVPNPSEHVIVLQGGGENTSDLNNYIFKKTPITRDDIEKVNEFSQRTGAKIVYHPYLDSKETYNRYFNGNKIELLLNANTRALAILSDPRNLKPVYDDSPFFFFILPLRNIFNPFYNQSLIYGGLSYSIITILLFTIVSLLFPLLWREKKTFTPIPIGNARFQKTFMVLLYFSLIGLAFIFIEMSMVQKFVLWLEQPIYSYSVVLASILFFSGCGSLLSGYFFEKKHISWQIAIWLVFWGSVYSLFLGDMIHATIAWPVTLKIIMASIIQLPIALAMGMFFPLGIHRVVGLKEIQLIPWCWAANGAFSVLGSLLAIILAVVVNFNFVLQAALVLYLMAGSLLFYVSRYTFAEIP